MKNDSNNFLSKRIFFITSSIPASNNDWKSVFIGDMLQSFSNKSQQIIYWGPDGVVPSNVVNSVNHFYQSWLIKMMNKGGIAKILRNESLFEQVLFPALLLLGIRSSAKKYNDKFDVYFVNWLQNSLSIPADGKALFITVLGSDMGLLNIKAMKHFLMRVFKNHKTTLLPNAEWMVEKLQSNFGNVADIRLLPLGIRDDWFDNVVRTPSIWISVSRITNKKVRKLFDWGNSIFSTENRLSLIGPNQEALSLPDWVDFKGSATLNELKTNWYPKAKALIFLSDHDEGRPQTIIEAMASGVPVICLNKPLYREFIKSGHNGYLVDTEAQLELVLTKLDDPVHNLMISKNARQTIRKNIGTWADYTDKVNDFLNN